MIESLKGIHRSSQEHLLHSIGDDAAVLSELSESVISVDSSVEGVHFTEADFTPSQIGYKAAATAISDIGAMGAKPVVLLSAIGVPAGLDEPYLLAVAEGIQEAATQFGAAVAGGDLTRSGSLSLAITVVGEVEAGVEVVLRSGAQPGDLVGVSGRLGGAAAGLQLLRGIDCDLAPSVATALIQQQRRPQPRVELGQALAAAGVSSMMDLSDGLATDATRLAHASKVTVTCRLKDLPLAEGVAELAGALGQRPAEFAARGGEEYELLFTAAPSNRPATEQAAAQHSAEIAWLGTVKAGEPGLRLSGFGGDVSGLRGFDHLAQERP